MLTFLHSGTLGDILSSLPAIRHLGGGELLLGPQYLNIGLGKVLLNQNHLGVIMNETQLNFLKPLLLNTGIVSDFRKVKSNDKIDYNLDDFRNFYEKNNFKSLISSHFMAIGITDFNENKKLQRENYLKPFLKVNNIRKIEGKYIGVSRTSRHREGSPEDHYFWKKMVDDGLDDVGIFFGLPEEHESFEKTFNIKIQHIQVNDALELAEYIAGVELFVSNATMAYWIATGLQKTTIIETRRIHPLEMHKWSRNECNNNRPNGLVMPFIIGNY